MWNFTLVAESRMSPAEQVLYALGQYFYRLADQSLFPEYSARKEAGHIAMDALDAMQERRNSRAMSTK